MAETDQRKPSITYGSIISISHIQDDDALIAGDGFIKRSVILKGMLPHMRSNSKKFSTDQFSQFYMSNCLFLVCPHLQNTVKGEILNQIQMESDKEQSPLLKEKDNINIDEVKIRELQIRLLNEYKYNIESFEKEKTIQVEYDQPIQLLHIASSKFLACDLKEAKFENQNYKLTLDYYPSEATMFRIVPAFKFQKDGDQIIYSSEVVRIIRSVPLLNKTTFVHCSGEMIDLKQSKHRSHNANKIQKREVNASLEEATSWKLNLFSEYVPENTKLLKIGDIIWLHHSEQNATLAATRQTHAFDRTRFQSSDLKDWLSLENLVVSVQPSGSSDSSFEQYQGNTYSMWILESSDYKEGGSVQYEKYYRLKHFSSGLYLGVARIAIESLPQPKVKADPYSVTKQMKTTQEFPNLKDPPAKFVLQNIPDKNTLFEFVALKQQDMNERFIRSGSFVYLKNVETKKYIDIVSRLDEVGTRMNQNNQKSHLLSSYLKPDLKNDKQITEQAVFKLYKTNASETWEIMFLDSCNKILIKFLYFISGFQWRGDASDVSFLKTFEKKLQNSMKTIKELDDFVNNRVYNSTPEQKYGSLSEFRQILLRQQYFIDILIKTLQESVSKNELEMWQNKDILLHEIEEETKRQDAIDKDKLDTSLQKKRKSKHVTKKQIIGYVVQKVNMCSAIYKLLVSIIKDNNLNQLYIYDLLPYFQIHAKFIPASVTFIIELVQNNMSLLLKLSQDLRIEFDYTTQQTVQQDMSKKAKVLINIFEKDNVGQRQQNQSFLSNSQMGPVDLKSLESKIAFKTHEKITQKPLNLINFFFNVLWDQESSNKDDYLRFLRSICRYHHQGVQINQENIYKLYKRFNNRHTLMGMMKDKEPVVWDGKLRMVKDKLIIPIDCDLKQMNFISEQLHFFAEVSFGRNQIWRNELVHQFPQKFLFQNIWQQQSSTKLQELQHLWCKLSMSLYVNHQPLRKTILPNYCRLFKHCDQPKQFDIFDVFSPKLGQGKSVLMSPLNELQDEITDSKTFSKTYKDLIQDLLQYLELLKQQVVAQVDQCDKLGAEILNDKLVYHTSELLFLLLQLDIFELVDGSQQSLNNYYMRIIEPLIYLIQYDRRNLKYLRASIQSIKGQVDKSKKIKADKNNPIRIPLDLTLLISSVNDNQDGQELQVQEGDGDDFNVNQELDDHKIYSNVIMRGFISLNNELDSLTYIENSKIKIEIDFKLKICSILDLFLDKRQNFLISNILVFFRRRVLKNGGFAQHVMSNDEIIEYEKDELIPNPNNKDDKLIEQVDKFMLGLIPNIAKTGINELDNPDKETNDPFAFINLKKIGFSEQKPERFINYFNHFKIDGFTEAYDIDQYLSLIAGDESVSQDPIASVLPYLLSTFFFVHDELLEERCLNVTMRVFNQREELRLNLKNLQILFDEEKSQLFLFIDRKLVRLTELIERSEVWLSEFNRKTGQIPHEMQECYLIIQNLSVGFYYNLVFEGGNICLMKLPVDGQNNGEIDPLKQSLMKFLQVHSPIIDLIKNGFHNLVEVIVDPMFPEKKKEIICNLFTAAYKFLTNFVFQNKVNQLILYEEIEIFQQYIQFNVGQCGLIQEIFRNNFKLLTTKVNLTSLKQIIQKIDHEGRQENFIDLVSVWLKCNNKYIFDNQLLILNTFLPLINLTDQETKVLYADAMKGKQIEFYFDDTLYETRDDLFRQLKDVDWKDTYRDEPFRYHAALLDLLIQTTLQQANRRIYDPYNFEINQRDNFNIGVIKLKKMIPAHTLLDLLKQADNMLDGIQSNKSSTAKQQESSFDKKQGFSILKLQICEFLRLVHITSDKRPAQSSEMAHLQREMSLLLEFEGHRLEQISEGRSYSKTYYIPYLIEGLLPLLISYHERYLVQHNQSELIDQLNNFSSKLSNCLQLILYKYFNTRRRAVIIQRFSHYYSNPTYLNFNNQKQSQFGLADKLLSMVEDFEDEEEQIQKQSANQSFNLQNKSKENSVLVSKQLLTPMTQKKKGLFDGLGSSLFKMNKSDDKKLKDYANLKDFDQEDLLAIEIQWNEFINAFVDSKILQDQIEQEKQVLADAIINVEQLLNEEFSEMSQVDLKPNIDMVIKKFINFLQYAVKQPKNKDTVVTLLKIMRKIIEKEENKEKKIELQNHFDKLGATKMILLIISEHSKSLNPEMLLSILHFANTLLLGGNQKVQKTIFNFFLQYQKSENLFQTFANIIQQEIVNIEQRAKDRKLEIALSAQPSSTESIDQQMDDGEEDSEQQEVILNQILQFLQNCVEGHFLDLQNYFRYQTNSRTSYNMIDMVSDLLKTYYYEERTVRMYDNMIKCLDTLSQMVQGPCKENQVAVAESKFIDVVQDLFPLRSTKMQRLDSQRSKSSTRKSAVNTSRLKSKQQSQEPIEPWMVARLQNKVLILLLSLLEMREIQGKNSMVKRIMRTLSIKVLERHLTKVYKNYSEIYGDRYSMKSLLHMDGDPRSQDKPAKYYETIIQNGFYMFSLISYYFETDEIFDSPMVHMHKAYLKAVVKKDDGLLSPNTTLGQLFALVMDLIEQSYIIAQALSNATLGKLKGQITEEEIMQRKQKLKTIERKRRLRKSFNFFMSNSAHIEIVREDVLEIVFFPLLPYCRCLPKDEKYLFQDEVNRSSTKSKVQTLVDKSDDLIEIMIHEEVMKTFYQTNRIIGFFANYIQLWKDIAYYLTLVLNLFIISSFAISNDDGQSDGPEDDRLQSYIFFRKPDWSREDTQQIFLILGAAMTCCSLFVVSFFLAKIAPLIIKRALKQEPLIKRSSPGIITRFINLIYRLFYILFSCLADFEVLYYLGYGVMAVVGTVIHPFFYSFHLTVILIRYPTLNNVVKSITEPKESLLLTLVLLLILSYIYTLVAYLTLQADYQGSCHSIFYCFLYSFDWNFKVPGGIGGKITQAGPNPNYMPARYISDSLSNLFIIIIMTNIVLGIIIDTFGSLREQENDKQGDIQDKCFMCGLENVVFEKKSDGSTGGFQNHIRVNHYMWNYVYYIAHIKYKQHRDFTGIESYVQDKLLANDLSWIPFNKAIELANLNDDESAVERKKVNNLDEQMLSMLENTKLILKAIKTKEGKV